MITKEQKIINSVKSDLPIKALPDRPILAKMKELYPNSNITLETVLEIYSMLDHGNEGGIVCGVCPLSLDRKTVETALLCSITHIRIKAGEKHFTVLEKYRQDRIRDLKRQNSFNPFRR